jgi:hypothetical protein
MRLALKMKKNKYIYLLTCLVFILSSCETAREAGKVLRNEKSRTTDEFLVKKKEPLSQPPNFRTIPEPGSLNQNGTNEDSINKILKIPEENRNINKRKKTGIENSILEKILK